MVVPRKPKDIQRILRRAKIESAEADLREYDRLLAEEIDHDPSIELSDAQKKEKAVREERLRLLGQRLTKGSN
jgi:hypothetical protein